MPERIDPRKARAERDGKPPQPADAEAVGERCVELEGELAELGAKYEQYFLGVERRPPTDLHDRVKRDINLLRQSTVRQTAAKFRVQSLHNKLLTFERLWTRTLQEIEAGTYRKHLFKARLHSKEHEKKAEPAKKPEAPNPLAAPAPGGPISGVTVPITGERAIVAAAAPRPSAPPAAGGTLSDGKMRAIFDAYVMAKKRCNEDTSKLSFESVSATLKQQVPALMKQHNAKSVEFKVVIKDGKAVLRALPTKE